MKPDEVNPYFKEIGESEIISSTDAVSLVKRAKVSLKRLLEIKEGLTGTLISLLKDNLSINQIEIEIKYEGYISRQKKDVDYFLQNENKMIPIKFDYNRLVSLSGEAKEKLIKIKPASLGQASRISGVSASDVSIISLYLK